MSDSSFRRPVRAVFLTPSLLMGGAERWMISLARHCPKEQVEWKGLALVDGAGIAPELGREMATLMPIHARAGVHATGETPLVTWPTAKEAVEHLASDADVLVTWGLPQLARWTSRVSIPIVYVSHSAGMWTAPALRSSESACSHFAAVSEAALAPFSRNIQARARVIHNGVDVDRCQPGRIATSLRAGFGVDRSARLVGYVGRLSQEKNPLAIAHAVSELDQSWHAVFCGEGKDAVEIIDAARTIIKNRLIVVPHQRNVGEILSQLDCFVLASSAEGFSLALAEAWYCGVPSVATRVGAVPELERRYGTMVSPVPIQASPRQLAGAIELATSTSFRGVVVPRARAIVTSRFTASQMGAHWATYLQNIRG